MVLTVHTRTPDWSALGKRLHCATTPSRASVSTTAGRAKIRRVLPLHPAHYPRRPTARRVLHLHRILYLLHELEAVRVGHARSKWFVRYKNRLGITDSRNALHSSHQTLIDDLQDTGVQDSLIERMANQEDGAVTFIAHGSLSLLRAWQMLSIKIFRPAPCRSLKWKESHPQLHIHV